MIKVSGLVKRYGRLNALKGLNIHVKKNSSFGLLGANGAGKTTLLSILNGLLDYDEGHVEILGMDLRRNKKEIRAVSSVIPQELAFYEKLTVQENLQFFGGIQKTNRKTMERAVEMTSLSGFLSQRAGTLSGGQKRRLNLAIGLLNDPQIIYFDEPTVGVDTQSRNEILDSIRSFRELGVTLVYTSHYLMEVERICDEVAIIAAGKLVEQDVLENLLTNRVSNQVIIEIASNYIEQIQDLKVLDNSLIETTEEDLLHALSLLKQQGVAVKQVRYGSTNLEKFFLETMEETDV